MTRKTIAIASILAVMLVLLGLTGGALYAQATTGDIPLMGKLQKGFHNPNEGIVDSWHIDYDATASLPAGARTSGTVWHQLNSFVATGNTVTAGGSFPASPGQRDLHIFDQDASGLANTEDVNGNPLSRAQRGDIFEYRGTSWVEIAGYDAIPDNTITEPMLAVQGNPSVTECIGWDGSEMEWSPCNATATGLTQVATGSTLTGDGTTGAPLDLADNSVNEDHLIIAGTKADGTVIEWDATNQELAWHDVGTLSLADGSVTEAKLSVSNNPVPGRYLQYKDNTDQLTWTQVTSGITQVSSDATLHGTGVIGDLLGISDSSITTARLADSAVTEPKMAIHGSPADGNVIEWDATNTRMQWQSVTAASISDDSVAEVKLDISNTPTDGYYLQYKDATDQLTWAQVSSGGLSAVSSDSSLSGDGTSGDPLGLANDGVTSAKIAVNAVTEDKLDVDNAPSDGYVLEWDANMSRMHWSSLGTVSLTDGSVTSPKIATDAVITRTIDDEAVTTDKLDDDAVTTDKIGTGEVETDNISNDAVTGAKIEPEAVEESDLDIHNAPTDGYYLEWDGTNGMQWTSITSGGGTVHVSSPVTGDGSSGDPLTIAAGGIGHTHLATNSVEADNLTNNSVTMDKIANGAVIESKLDISNTAVNNYPLLWNDGGSAFIWKQAVTGSIADDAITGDKIADAAVGSDQLASSAVIEAKIGLGAVTEPKLDISNTAAAGQFLQYKDSTDELTWATPATGLSSVNTSLPLQGDGTSGSPITAHSGLQGTLTPADMYDGTASSPRFIRADHFHQGVENVYRDDLEDRYLFFEPANTGIPTSGDKAASADTLDSILIIEGRSLYITKDTVVHGTAPTVSFTEYEDDTDANGKRGIYIGAYHGDADPDLYDYDVNNTINDGDYWYDYLHHRWLENDIYGGGCCERWIATAPPANWLNYFDDNQAARDHVTSVGQVLFYPNKVYVVDSWTAGSNTFTNYEWVEANKDEARFEEVIYESSSAETLTDDTWHKYDLDRGLTDVDNARDLVLNIRHGNAGYYHWTEVEIASVEDWLALDNKTDYSTSTSTTHSLAVVMAHGSASGLATTHRMTLVFVAKFSDSSILLGGPDFSGYTNAHLTITVD